MKKKMLFLIDILTSTLLIIQIQSMIVLFFESYAHLKDYTWNNYIELYDVYGITDAIYMSSYKQLYLWVIFIVFCLNIYSIAIKFRDIKKTELYKGIYRGFIIFNILFVVLRALEFCLEIYFKLGA